MTMSGCAFAFPFSKWSCVVVVVIQEEESLREELKGTRYSLHLEPLRQSMAVRCGQCTHIAHAKVKGKRGSGHKFWNIWITEDLRQRTTKRVEQMSCGHPTGRGLWVSTCEDINEQYICAHAAGKTRNYQKEKAGLTMKGPVR